MDEVRQRGSPAGLHRAGVSARALEGFAVAADDWIVVPAADSNARCSSVTFCASCSRALSLPVAFSKGRGPGSPRRVNFLFSSKPSVPSVYVPGSSRISSTSSWACEMAYWSSHSVASLAHVPVVAPPGVAYRGIACAVPAQHSAIAVAPATR